LTVFLAAALLRCITAVRESGWRDLRGDAAQLGLWFLGSLTIFTLIPVKEPRHVAPCVVPAVLLAFWGLERCQRPMLRNVLVVLAVVVSVGQFLVVTQRVIYTPYYLKDALHLAAVERQMHLASPPASQDLREEVRRTAWAYNQNVAIAGFEPNAALALTWYLFPAVVFDLDVLSDQSCFSQDEVSGRFEDLYLLSAFSTYNRRIGACRYCKTLSRDEVVEGADFILVKDGADLASSSFPRHEPCADVETTTGPIRILKAKQPSADSYRLRYARAYLRQHPDLSLKDRNTVAQAQLYALIFRGRFADAEKVLAANRGLHVPNPAVNNIYWIRQYDVAHSAAVFLFAQHFARKKR
jgi:hypothetical protein